MSISLKKPFSKMFSDKYNASIDNRGDGHESENMLEDFWDIDEEMITNPPAGLNYEIQMDLFFNASHSVVIENLTGPLHSHSFRLQVCCRSQFLAPDNPVLITYQDLRACIKKVASAYNNQVLNNLPPFQTLQPTIENLTAIIFQQLNRLISGLKVELAQVTLWESPTEAITIHRY